MSLSNGREHYIPLRQNDLVDLLCQDERLTEADRDQFRRFCSLVSSLYTVEYYRRLEELRTAYAPFDPDLDIKSLRSLSAAQEQARLNDFFREITWLLERADYRHLSCEEIEAALNHGASGGLRMEVDFSAFERMALFGRSEVLQKRARRTVRNFFRHEEVEVPVYQRLVLLLKMRPERCRDNPAEADCVYLKAFKDIPKIDIKMLLPSTRVRMTKVDRTRIGFPLLSGLGLALYNIGMQVVMIGREIGEFLQSSLTLGTLWGVALGGIGYGYRSYYGYMQTKQRYRLTLTQNLYFQNLDNNSGVLFRLLSEAKEQECREAFLAYFLLWRRDGGPGATRAELTSEIERYLDQVAHIQVAFGIEDALAKLEKLQLVEIQGDQVRAAPISAANEKLVQTWDSYFPNMKPNNSGEAILANNPALA